MERVERRHEGRVRVYPDKIPHPAFRNELGNLVGGVAVRVNKKSAVALADVFDEEIDEQRGLAHAGHPLDVYMPGGVNGNVLPVDGILADADVHLKTVDILISSKMVSFISSD